MRTEKEILNRIRALEKEVKMGGIYPTIHNQMIDEIQILRWVLDEPKK
jgi:hypothetical protein